MSAINIYDIQDEVDNLDHGTEEPWNNDSSAPSETDTADEEQPPSEDEARDTESDRQSDSSDSTIFTLTTRIAAPDAQTVRTKYALWLDELRT
jgi:cobalamin biosynthesis protein CobT